jgi:NAD-dependent dihydropyrimidine dehydrogenase PreA subunit
MEVFEKSEKEIIIKEGKCVGCKACEIQCEKGAIKVDDE